MQETDWRLTLIDAHQSIFRDETGAIPGHPDVGDGWRDLIETAVARLAAAVAGADAGTLHVDQIKEKYGTLRFYVHGTFAADDRLRAPIELAIDLAEARSACTCDVCGSAGRLYERAGWLTTRCDEHAEGKAVPLSPERSQILIRRQFVDGRVQIVTCRRYDRQADIFTDVDPAQLGFIV